MNDKSNTPRTDSAIMVYANEGVCPDRVFIKYVTADFARQIERELNQWRQMAEELARVVELKTLAQPFTDCHCAACSALTKFNQLKGQQ